MNITLNPEKSLKSFQDEFHAVFPFLRIKFFSHSHLEGQASMAKDEINVAKTFKEVAGLDHIDSFEISGSMTVAELENHFQQNYKIGVQIMRQSGNAWIMTTQTDGWTLRKSNETGREDSH